MKKTLLTLGFLLGLSSLAAAQINVVPSVGLTTGYLPKATYSSSFVGLVPVTAATDVVCIAGSATKTIRLQYIKLWGTAATAVQAFPVMLLRRVSVDTGGTAGSTTANPGITTQIAKRDVTNPTATATLVSYTANPTIVDTAPTYLDSSMITLPVVTSVTNQQAVDFNFSRDIENLMQAPTLVGAAAQICVNFNGVTITNAATLNGVIAWTEE